VNLVTALFLFSQCVYLLVLKIFIEGALLVTLPPLMNFYASAKVVARGIMFPECSCASVHACVDFECKYLCNGWRYRQEANGFVNYNLSCIEQKMVNFSPLRTTVSWLMFTHFLQ